MRTGTRQKLVGAFGVAGVGLLATTTAAYACTVYRGQVTLSGNAAGNVAQTWKGTGSGMNWCTVPTPTAKVIAGNASVSLVTAATVRAGKCAAGQLRADTYKVAVTTPMAGTTGYMAQGGGTGATHNCHGTTGTVVDTGSVTGTSGVFVSATTGTATVNYTVPAGVGSTSICIYGDSSADAIAANFDQV